MFGFHVQIVQSGSRLVVTSPADVLMLLAFMTLTVWPLLILVNQRPMPRRKVVVLGTITLVVYGFLTNCTRLTLDRDAGVARFEQFHWYHWTRQEVPLTDVDHAYLARGRGADQLVLEYGNGSTRAFSVQNQMGGKRAAVAAINRFLEGE